MLMSKVATAGLHDQYEDAFLIGVAVGSEDINHVYKFPMKKNADEWKIINNELKNRFVKIDFLNSFSNDF